MSARERDRKTVETLGDLQQACSDYVGIGTNDVRLPCCTQQWGAREEQRRVIDLTCCYAVALFERRERVSPRDAKEWLDRQVSKHIRHRKAGFAPLVWVIGPLLSWLLQKAIGWLWNWWTKDESATRVVAGMAQAAIAAVPCCAEA